MFSAAAVIDLFMVKALSFIGFFLYLPEMNSGSEKPVLEPLLLPSLQQDSSSGRTSPRTCLPCLMCVETFDITTKKEDCLRHLLTSHKLVIADVNLIANFKRLVHARLWKYYVRLIQLVPFH